MVEGQDVKRSIVSDGHDGALHGLRSICRASNQPRCIYFCRSSGAPVSSQEDDHRAGQHPVSERRHRRFLPGYGDVERTVEPRVDRPPPAARRALLDLKVERLVVRVDHDVEVAVALRCTVQAIGDAARSNGQVDARPDPYQ